MVFVQASLGSTTSRDHDRSGSDRLFSDSSGFAVDLRWSAIFASEGRPPIGETRRELRGGRVEDAKAARGGSRRALLGPLRGRRLAYTYAIKEVILNERFVMSTAEGAFPRDDLPMEDPCSSPSDGACDERIMKRFGSLDGRNSRRFT